jgi:hypothetical protein
MQFYFGGDLVDFALKNAIFVVFDRPQSPESASRKAVQRASLAP